MAPVAKTRQTHEKDHGSLSGRDGPAIHGRGFRSAACRINRVGLSMNDIVVKGILDVGGFILRSEQAPIVCLVLGEHKFRRPFAAVVINGKAPGRHRDRIIAGKMHFRL